MARTQAGAVASLYVGMVKKGIGRLMGGAKAGSEPFSAQSTPLNAQIRTPRSIATLSLPIAEMRAAGKAFGGTLNDVAVTVVPGRCGEAQQPLWEVAHAELHHRVGLEKISSA